MIDWIYSMHKAIYGKINIKLFSISKADIKLSESLNLLNWIIIT